MGKRILAYRRYIDALLAEYDCGQDSHSKDQHMGDSIDWKRVAEEHLVQIGFFQHERLIHLIVTVTFAMLEMLAVCMTLLAFTPFMGALALLLLVLLIPYVRHYYILENEVQRMYVQYDRIAAKQGDGQPYFNAGALL